jgi:hypothetical protein
MSSTNLRDLIRKKNNFIPNYTNSALAMSGEGSYYKLSGEGLLLAGQSRPSGSVSTQYNNANFSKPAPKPKQPTLKPAPKKPKPKPTTGVAPALKPKPTTGVATTGIMTGDPNRVRNFKPVISLTPRMSGNPNRVRNFKNPHTKVKGRPFNVKLGQYADLADAFEAGDSTPFVAESASALGELLMGLL